MRVALATAVLVSSLLLVAWRQSRAREALAELDGVRQERALAESERAALLGRIESLESRARVAPAARARLGMHTPDASEIRILPGDLD